MLLWELRKLIKNNFFKSVFLAMAIVAIIFTYYFSDTESTALTFSDATKLIDGVIKKAESNYSSVLLNSPENEYAKNYQTTAAKQYRDVITELNIDEKAEGWDIYFGSDRSILTLLLITFTVPVVFSLENSTGMIPVMRTAKCGRRKTAFAKTEAAVIVSLVAVLTVELVGFAVVYVKHGYSSAAYSIQSFADLVFVPYSVSILEYFGLHLLCSAVTAIAYGLMLNALTSAFYSGLLSSAAGIVFYLFNLLLKLTLDLDKSSLLRVCNFVNISSVHYVLSDYGYVKIGEGIIQLYLVISVGVIVSALFFTIPIAFSSLKPVNLCFKTIEKSIKNIFSLKKDKVLQLPCYSPRTVFGWETYKLLISGRGILILLIMILFGSFILSDEYKYDASGSVMYYETYMQKLEGEYTDEKYQSVLSRYNELSEIIDEYDMHQEAYQRGEITFWEFDEIQVMHHNATTELELLTPVFERAEHLKNLDENGIKGDFFADTGIVKLYSQGFNPVFYLAAVMCFSSVFSCEYINKTSSGTMASIIKATKKGRNKTYFAKYTASILWVSVMSLAIFSLEIFYIHSVYPITGLSSPLISIIEYGEASPGITVFAHLIKVLSVRLTGGVLISILINALSEITASSVKAVVCGILLTGFLSLSSLLLRADGIANLGYFNAFGGEGSTVVILIYTVMIFALFFVSYISYGKNKKMS